MLNSVIAFSLKNRWLVLLLALILVAIGTYQLGSMPVDVFPDLNRPTVAVLTESPGLAPEEVEALVTRPIETLLNGAPGVERVRSASGIGLSIVWAEFAWGSDIYQDRQLVNEKIQLARERLPADTNPVLAPISSIMGEIMLVGVRPAKPAQSEQERATQAMEVRTLAEFPIRNRILSVPGVSQVTVLGGIFKQYQILTSPERLAAHHVTLAQLTDAAEKANVLAGGGIMERQVRESLIRISGQSLTLDEIGETPIAWRGNRAVKIRDVAQVRFGGPIRRGDGSVRVRENNTIVGGPAVVMSIFKQPGSNTLDLDPKLDAAIAQLQAEYAQQVVFDRQVFRQANFIRSAVDNVIEAIRDGVVWVILVLLLFMGSLRTSLITLTAIPLSALSTLLVFRGLGLSINTMTLGGLAVAIGELVDDAIVDVENIVRRIKENRHKADPQPALKVIYEASREIRGSIVYATLVVCLVVLPLFALSGLEGRMFAPLGLAYLLSLLASLVVSLTVTPALSSVLLPRARFIERGKEPALLRFLKYLDAKIVRWSLKNPWKIVVVVAVFGIGSKLLVAVMGSEFLPPFSEGTLTVSVELAPGTSLEESTRVAIRAEELMFEVPEVTGIVRRTGRAEMDEHAEGVHSSEMDVRYIPHEVHKPGLWPAFLRGVPGLHQFGVERQGRPSGNVLADIRYKLSALPNVLVNVGQPMSHRLDHVMSGVRAQIAIKIYGNDLRALRDLAEDAESSLHTIAGIVDLQVEPQVEVPQVRLRVKRQEAARYGLAPGDVSHLLETAYKGKTVSLVIDEDRFHPLVVWYEEQARSEPAVIGETILSTPSGRLVALSQVAEVLDTTGPNTLNHENSMRRIVVSCNVQGRDLGSVVAEIQEQLQPVQAQMEALGSDYRLVLSGQFEAQQQAGFRLTILASASIVGVFLLLWRCLQSWRAALMVLLVNIPLAAVGSVAALMIVNHPDKAALAAAPWWQWPTVWASATTLSLAHWIGFITLLGIVTRNGIMMISHYIHLMKYEGEGFTEEMIVRGSLERLAPVLMTAATAILGLIPLAMGEGQPGKEILYPLAIVVIGGLLDSTIMDQVVTPAVFWKFGRKVYQPDSQSAKSDTYWDDHWTQA